MEDEDTEECSHVWRPFWSAGYISHYICDKCGDYVEEDFDDEW